MKPFSFCGIVAAIGCVSAFAAEVADKNPATLRWNNGETIPGELVEASASELTWKTSLFEDPLVVNWHALRRIDQTAASIVATDPFSIVLRNGSHLYGDLVAITADAVTIRSSRFGEVSLKRSEVLSARRLRGGSVVMAGPAGGAGWGMLADRKGAAVDGRPPVRRSNVPALVAGPGGALILPFWNSGAFIDFTLPERLELDFRVRSSKRPDFQIALDTASKQRLRIETWNEQLVVAAADQFQAIRSLGDDEREVSLRLCWDRKAGKCSLFAATGESIADWPVPDDTQTSTTGLVLRNKGRDLALEFVRVRKWDGNPPAAFDRAQPRIELADGRTLSGEIVGVADGSVGVQPRPDEPAQNFQIAEVGALIFSADPPRVSEPEATLAFADGTYLLGRIAAVDHGRIMLDAPFAAEPVGAKWDALRQVLLKVPPPAGTPPARPLAELDQIVMQKTTLHGTFAGAGDPWPRWLPVGGVRPSMPAKKLPSEIRRALPPEAPPKTPPALFYTHLGDVIPATLRALDRNKIEFDSDVIEAKTLPAADLDAIQFGTAAGANINGFKDPGWRVLKGDDKTVRRTGDTLAMEPETSLGHPSAMQASEIKFQLTTENFCTVRLRLFCAGTDGSKSPNLVLMRMGDRVSGGLEGSDGQFNESISIRATSGSPVSVNLVVQSKTVELHLNDALTQKVPIDPAKRAGSGLVIEPSSMWGNPVQPIALAGFSAVVEPGRTWLPEVNPEVRTQTLTVPRFRKDEPPRQVLLAANGDLLRGEIEAISSTHFGFRSGLETLRIPRDRVKAAIWLKKPSTDAPAAVVKPPGSELLEQKLDSRTTFPSIGLASITTYLERKFPGLKFKLPPADETRRAPVQFGNQTLGEAIEQICLRFGLRQRLDESGAVVLEAAPVLPADLVEKVYWLKSDLFAAIPPAQEILAQKGLQFPTGTFAKWQPETRQLTVANTPANHAKLAEFFQAEYGESPASPTHWFQLRNGGRLGLEVEKFGAEFVTGRHPAYGRCTLPLAQIVSLQSSRPEPAPANKAFADWRLVFSPEPVIQDTGGQSSPLLGQPAKPFKLPLLGGGDFDLAQVKGKIVVLDFWATWCGPCIKSLPALIASLDALGDDRVKLIGVNQSEPADEVKKFLETRKWKLTVALDAGQNIGRLYGAEGIPHTVIIGLDGKVAWVKSGTNAGPDNEAAEEVQRLLKAN